MEIAFDSSDDIEGTGSDAQATTVKKSEKLTFDSLVSQARMHAAIQSRQLTFRHSGLTGFPHRVWSRALAMLG